MELNDSCSTVLPSASLTVFLAELVHHRLGDLVVGARPDIDDLVVTLAVR